MPDNVPRIYCVDSSLLITFNRVFLLGLLPANIWDLLDGLFAAGRVLSHQFVFDEICPNTTKPDFLATWIKDKQRFFHPVTLRQTEIVQQLLAQFPTFIDYTKEINEADPWLIALALEKRESSTLLEDFSNLTVVSNESGRSTVKIPAACDFFGIPHFNLKEFFADNQWTIKLES
jgi:hypothetical protein